jgi:hypothetical protein
MNELDNQPEDSQLTPTIALNVLINVSQTCLGNNLFNEQDSMLIYNSLILLNEMREKGEDILIKVSDNN